MKLEKRYICIPGQTRQYPIPEVFFDNKLTEQLEKDIQKYHEMKNDDKIQE